MANDETVKALREQVQRLQDLEDIRQLYVNYGLYLDACDADSYAMLFAKNAKMRYAPVITGNSREEIKEGATKIMRKAPDGSRRVAHVLGSPKITELNGDTAKGECVWSVITVTNGVSKILVGRHLDELVREDGEWRFSLRRGVVDVGSLG